MFVLPNFLHEDAAYFQSIHALGASVQDHTVRHADLRKLDSAAQQREICGVLSEYGLRFGTRPWLFRPPGGFLNQSVPVVARRCGIRAVVTWRATMNDGRLDVQGAGRSNPATSSSCTSVATSAGTWQSRSMPPRPPASDQRHSSNT